MPGRVFVTGGTGYIGSRLAARLLQRGHVVDALVRPGSQLRLPAGCNAVPGNALDRHTFERRIAPAETFVQLVGTPHPSPAKARQFHGVDLVSARESAAAAAAAGIAHFVYVSVAQGVPVMLAYQQTRALGEAAVREHGLRATVLRPWYVLGPGHRWPYLLAPLYWLAERVPATRERARRAGLVTLEQMLQALVFAVEHRPGADRVVGVVDIRRGSWNDEQGPALGA
jgi:nucleoside-diphosphate-sugar epimerase